MTFVIIAGGIDLSVGSMAAFVGVLGVLAMNALGGGGPARVAGASLAAVARRRRRGLGGGARQRPPGHQGPHRPLHRDPRHHGHLPLPLPLHGRRGRVPSTNAALLGDIGSASVCVRARAGLDHAGPGRLASPSLLGRTRYGRYVRAVGSNDRVALYSAIDVDRVRFLTYVINGFVVGVSAVLISMRFNAVGTSTLGVNYELDAIAAVIIGGTAMAGGRGTIWGTVVGAIILGVINNMLNMVGVSPYLQGTVKGLVIIGAVFSSAAEGLTASFAAPCAGRILQRRHDEMKRILALTPASSSPSPAAPSRRPPPRPRSSRSASPCPRPTTAGWAAPTGGPRRPSPTGRRRIPTSSSSSAPPATSASRSPTSRICWSRASTAW